MNKDPGPVGQEFFQSYQFDPYLGKSSTSRLQSIEVLHDTTPMGQTLTEYFARKYKLLHKLI